MESLFWKQVCISYNKLRVDDYVHLIEKVKLESLSLETKINQKALEVLSNGFQQNERFQTKTKEVNATTTTWIVAKQRGGPPPVGQVAGVDSVKPLPTVTGNIG